jgi:hypothetical protein
VGLNGRLANERLADGRTGGGAPRQGVCVEEDGTNVVLVVRRVQVVLVQERERRLGVGQRRRGAGGRGGRAGRAGSEGDEGYNERPSHDVGRTRPSIAPLASLLYIPRAGIELERPVPGHDLGEKSRDQSQLTDDPAHPAHFGQHVAAFLLSPDLPGASQRPG